jgi:hypothetical protein
MVMENQTASNKTASIESLFQRIKTYGETRIELLKLKAIDKSSSFLSILLTYILVLVVFGFFFLFLNIGLALLIGELIGKAYYGFFIIAVLYAIAGIVLLRNKDKWIKTRVINMMVKGLQE